MSDGERTRLEASLSFLSTDYQFSSDQVGCVREQLERRVSREEIAALDEQLRGVDAGNLSIDDLPADQGEAVTAAIATCAVAE